MYHHYIIHSYGCQLFFSRGWLSNSLWQLKTKSNAILDKLEEGGFDLGDWNIEDAHNNGFINGYLAGAEEVKADCDFALEGKDVEIKELKEVLKGLLEEEKGLWFKADGSDKSRYYKLREKAEQFLKEIKEND